MIHFQFMLGRLRLPAFIGLFLFVVISMGCNDDQGGGGDEDNSSFVIELLTKAEPDECFCGIGAEDNGPISNSITGDCSDLTPEEPFTVCKPKRNHSYVWALTKIGNQLWFGTVANVICVLQTIAIVPEPIIEDTYVCEFGESHLASSKPNPALGDHRTPQIIVYDTGTGTTQNVSVDGCEGGNELLDSTSGLRQAGSLENGEHSVVILGGPSLLGGFNMFAFDAKSRSCLSAKNFPQYNDGRKMIVVDGVLYAAVGRTPDGDNTDGGGRVLRYVGGMADALTFVEVGKLDTIGANLTYHEGRIYVGTWPNLAGAFTGPIELPQLDSNPALGGVYMSPPVPMGGLTADNFDQWEKIWETGDYEPDLAAVRTYGLGDLASYDKALWFGTMHVPFTSFALHSLFFEPDLFSFDIPDPSPECSSDPDCLVRFDDAIENSERATAVFRGRSFDSTPEFDLLYGESSLPVYNSSLGQWEEKQNNSSAIPLFGKSGIDNSQNFYTWAMAVFGGQLFLGTFDGSISSNEVPDNPFGADLFRFSDSSSGAMALSLDGLGNPLNYGIRTMLSDEDGEDDDDAIYIGTANPFNLASEGGWEIWRLRGN